MATGPAFVPADAFPASYGDALERVLDDDRAIRRLMAQRAVNLIKAQREQVRPDRFENRMLANRSFRAEVAAMLNITEKAAENLIGYSDALVDAFPATLDALGRGDITWQHATVIADELGGLPKSSRDLVEVSALAEAPSVTPHKLGRILRLARESINPELIPERHAAARERRGVELLDDRDGMGGLYVPLPSVHAHAIFNKLTAAAVAMNDPLDDRTLNQRRADVFVHVMLAEVDGQHFGVIPDQSDDENFVKWYRGIKAEVVVSVPVLTLLGQSDEPATLGGWVPIDPATAVVLAAGADSFIRILTHPETGVVLSVARKRYKVPKDLRRLLQIRDLTCRFPGCTLAAERSDIDHTLDWQFGGETKLSNLACLCRGHHTLKGNTPWTVTQAPDGSGVMTWTSPAGRTYRTFPQRPIAA
jgi:hypothetical protein